jgi:myo-inositol-1(or 4)-monophosphatase
VSEEGGGAETLAGGAEYLWHIDPIDGTANFSKNLPLFAISIGLSDRDYVPLVGVVYNPVYRDLFSAARGHGATHNGRTLRVSTADRLDQAVLASGFPTHPEGIARNLEQWRKFLFATRGMRRFGSAALDLAFVSAGWLDGFFETGLHSWDVTAGLLLVSEAGGRVTDLSGGTAKVYTGEEIVTSNGLLHDEIMRLIKE